MESKPKAECGNCNWFRKGLVRQTEMSTGRTFESGVCRRNAPSMNKHGATVWPDVWSDDWCGEFTVAEQNRRP